MKKLLAILLVLAMIFALAACGGKNDADEETAETEATETTETEEENKPKEAEPTVPAPKDTAFGDVTLKAEHIPFDVPFMIDAYKEPSMDVLGNTIYIADGDKKVKIYTYEGGALTLSKEMDVKDTGDCIAVDGNGNLYLNGGVFEATIYDPEGNETGKAAASGEIAVAKTADFALTRFPGQKAVTKISGGAAEDWVINKLGTSEGPGKFDNVNAIKIQGDHVIVGGADTEKGLIAAFDFSGNQLFVSTDDPDGNLPEVVAETANGYMSTSAGTLNLISPDGKLIAGEITDDLFGVDYAWIYGLAPMEDGSFLALITNHVQDASNAEILLYKVTGF